MLNKYIEQAIERNKISQNKLAKMMGITGSALSQAKRGDATIGHDALGKLARACNIKPEIVIADYELNKSHTPEIKMMWERISGHAAVWLIAIMPTLFLIANTSNIYYVKLCI